MKSLVHLVLSSVLCFDALAQAAQDTKTLDQLQRQLQEMQRTFQQNQEQDRKKIEKLQKQIDDLRQAQGSAAERPEPPPTAPVAEAQRWSPSNPITLLGSSRNYIDLSFDALVAAGGSTADDIDGGTQLGGHDPKQRGFTVQNLETVFTGKVDPYFRGQANVVLQIDPEGETTIEAEEAYLETMSLPWNLQVKAGQYFTEFGRINPMHPHAWDFVDQPLVNGRLLGEDGLRNPGARISWLTPTPFYSELLVSVQDSQGETAYSFRDDHGGEPLYDRLHSQGSVHGFGDMLFVPRYVASFDLTDTQTLMAGASAALGPNGSGDHMDTQVYGIDLFWKWKSRRQHGGFPFVTWQTEAMWRRYEAGAFDWDLNGDGLLESGEADLNGDGVPDTVPGETLVDYGFYTQVSYGFHKGWVVALRGDWVGSDTAEYETLYGPDPNRTERFRISPNLTYYPSEYSKIRLQYNFDHRSGIGPDHSLWVQFEFLLGSHAAHQF